MSTHFRFRY